MLILTGSKAAKLHFPDFPRDPKDTDYISDIKWPLNQDDGRAECHIVPPVYKRFLPVTNGIKVMSPDQLYTLKYSHILWDIFWKKTIFDIVWFKEHGCKLDLELLEELREYWVTVHGEPKRANLNISKQEFFTNGIKDGHRHDDLHLLIQNPPTYEKIKIGEVEVSEEKFFELSFEDKMNIIREEVYVMAYERLGTKDYRDAYQEQLKAWIITHAPTIKMAMFAVDNYRSLVMPEYNYVEKINLCLKGSK